MTISVITAAIPSRSAMLAECVASIASQTVAPLEHLIAVDHRRDGSSAARNGLLRAARGDWIAVLDDDDIAHANHLERLVSASDEADIVYTFCRVTGKEWNPNACFDAERLRNMNYIPATALIRTDLLRSLEGWRDSADCQAGQEDWDLWLRALNFGARFVCVPEVTWTYRFHGGNKSVTGEAGAR